MKQKCISNQIIYKFVTINNNNLNALNDGKIWLSHPSQFNDPFDATLRIHGEEDYDILMRHLGEWINDDPQQVIPPSFTDSFYFALRYSKKGLSQLISYLENEMPNAIALKKFMNIYSCLGVSSFATEPHDPKMWSSYGNGHKGVCVRYTLTSNVFNAQKILHCKSVQYKAAPHGAYSSDDAFEVESILDQLSLKSLDWANEREVRLISLSRSNCLVEVPGLNMIGICFGLYTSPTDQKLIRNLLKINYPNLTYYNAHLNDHFLKIDWQNSLGGFEENLIYQTNKYF